MNGLQLIAKIHAKCINDGGCLVWQGYSHQGQPQIKHAGKVLGVRRLLWESKNGELPAGRVMAHTCETSNCVSHCEPRTRTEVQQRVAATGVYSAPPRRAKIAAARRKVSKLDWETVRDIRACSSIKEAAAKHGMCETRVGEIRRGERWRDFSNPFAGLVR